MAHGGENVGVGWIDRLLEGREERPALQDSDAGQLPAACQVVHQRATLEPPLAVAEGQVVEVGGQEAVPAVVDHITVIHARIEAVGEKAAAGDGKGAGRGPSGIGKVPGKGVTGVEGDRLAAVARDLGRSAGVVALGGVHDALDYGPTGIGTAVGGLRVTKRVGRHLVQIPHGLEIPAAAARIGEADAEGVAQILLDGQVPLLHRRVDVMDGEGVVEVGGSRGAAGQRVEGIGEGEQRRDSIGVVVLVVSGQITGMDSPAGDQREAQRSFNEASPASAHDGLVAAQRPPGKAQPRAPIRLVRIPQRPRKPGLRGGQDGRGRNGIGKLRGLEGLGLRVGHHHRSMYRLAANGGAVIGIEDGGVETGLADRRVKLVAQPQV